MNPVRPDGTFEEGLPLVGGVFFKKADEALTEDLAARGKLFRHVPYEHSYPHCWRCHTALLYYAQPSWYIRTTAVKDRLLQENEKTNWFPDSVKNGRFGDWLNNNVDWALSRNRYWGTPLPIWRCEDGHLTCVGSRTELGELAGTDLSGLDPHRPFIDDITFTCTHENCQLEAYRVPEVIDAWYDSGSMPFAQWGYPYKNKELFESRYPAQFISEAIDQTRGWFYTLMAVGTLVFDKSSYENVVCLGHILAEDGRKMSKHLGNTLEPIPLMDRHGADAVRWFMAAAWLPVGGAARRSRHHPGGRPQDAPHVLEHGRLPGPVRPYVELGAVRGRPGPGGPYGPGPLAAERAERAGGPGHAGSGGLRHPARLQAAVRLRRRPVQLVRTPLAPPLLAGRQGGAAHPARGRRDGDPADGPAHPVHHRAGLAGPGRPGHAGRPRVGPPLRLAEGGPVGDRPRPLHADGSGPPPGRAGPGHPRRVRCEDPSAAVPRPGRGVRLRDALPELHTQITEELNVSSLASLSEVGGSLVDTTAKANFRALGKRFGKGVQAVAKAVANADAAALSLALREGTASVEVDGETVTLSPDEVIITETPREGWSVASDSGATVALDLEITPELRRAGLARDAIRLIQEARKNSGLDVADRIAVRWTSASPATVEALTEHAALIADEVLALDYTQGEADPTYGEPFEDEGLALAFRLRKTEQ